MRIYSGGPLQVPDVSIPATLYQAAKRYPDKVGFRIKQPDGPFKDLKWKQVAEQTRDIANGLMSLGVGADDKVAILSNTRGEWSLADYGIMSSGAVVVTVYPTLTADQVSYLLNDSGAKAIFVEDQSQFDKLKKVAEELKTVEHFITIDDVDDKGSLEKQTLTWTGLLEAGRSYGQANPNAVQDRLNAIDPDDVATLVYTSGTTGTPKGAILTHRNFVSAFLAGMKQLELENDPSHSTLLFLPLAHCYARMVSFMVTYAGGEVGFSSPKSLGDDLREVKPTLLASVPRLYERMYDQIQSAVADSPENKQKIFHRASDVAREYGRAISNGGSAGFGLKLKHALFDKLVYSKLRERLGMTELRVGITGAAAIRPDLLYFFQGIGVNLLEGYGLTETSAPSNVNRPRKFKPGTVGPPFPGMEQTIAEDGEVLMKGPNVFKGYYNLESETNEAFNDEGWFCTGDIGEFDADGYLKIVDRKKELEILDTGKNVAPVTVEEELKTASPLISEAAVIGQGRKFCGALIQPNYDNLVKWAKKNDVPFDESKVIVQPDPTGNPMTYAVGEDLLSNEKVQAAYRDAIAKANEELADYEQVKTFNLVPHAFTMDRDELTPTLKKKRRVIRAHYEDLIEDMFAKAKKAPKKSG